MHPNIISVPKKLRKEYGIIIFIFIIYIYMILTRHIIF